MNLGVVIGYGVSETKEMAQNWRGADMFCVISCDCDCNVWCVCVIVIVIVYVFLNLISDFSFFNSMIPFHDTLKYLRKTDRLPVATHSLYQVR